MSEIFVSNVHFIRNIPTILIAFGGGNQKKNVYYLYYITPELVKTIVSPETWISTAPDRASLQACTYFLWLC
jgi:hypothetical protein